MKRMKFILLLTSVAAAAACGGDDTDAAADTTTTSTTTTTTTEPPPTTIVPVPDDVCERMDSADITAALEASKAQREMYFEYFDTIGKDPIPPADRHAMTGPMRTIVEDECPEHLSESDLGVNWDDILAAVGQN